MTYKRGWDAENTETLKRMWAAGDGENRIAEACGKTPEQVRKRRSTLGLPVRKKGMVKEDRWGASQVATLRREWIIGTSVKHIVDMVQKDEKAVVAKRIDLGLDARRQNTDTKAIPLYLEGTLRDDVARKAMVRGMSRSAYIRKLIIRDLSA